MEADRQWWRPCDQRSTNSARSDLCHEKSDRVFGDRLMVGLRSKKLVDAESHVKEDLRGDLFIDDDGVEFIDL